MGQKMQIGNWEKIINLCPVNTESPRIVSECRLHPKRVRSYQRALAGSFWNELASAKATISLLGLLEQVDVTTWACRTWRLIISLCRRPAVQDQDAAGPSRTCCELREDPSCLCVWIHHPRLCPTPT